MCASTLTCYHCNVCASLLRREKRQKQAVNLEDAHVIMHFMLQKPLALILQSGKTIEWIKNSYIWNLLCFEILPLEHTISNSACQLWNMLLSPEYVSVQMFNSAWTHAMKLLLFAALFLYVQDKIKWFCLKEVAVPTETVNATPVDANH